MGKPLRPAIPPIEAPMALPEQYAHRGPKSPPRPPFPPEIPVYGPSPESVHAIAVGLAHALSSHALTPGLRVGLVADPFHSGPAAISSYQAAPPRREAPPGTGARLIGLEAPAWDARERRAALADCDVILAAGRPHPDRPGLLVLPEVPPGDLDVSKGGWDIVKGARDPASANDPSPLACVGAFRPTGLPSRIPVLPADRPEALAALVLDRLRAQAAPLYGLVLGGGRSERMGTDKAALAYHGRPQTQLGLDLLGPFCAQTFVSCRAEQAAEPAFAGLPQIHDTFLGLGPLGGILSALRAHPGAAFLVIACDLPFLDAATLKALAAGRDPLRVATAFAGPQAGLPEPLCAIYESRAYARGLQLLGQGTDCPRKLILASSAVLLPAPDARALRNVNLPGEYREALDAL